MKDFLPLRLSGALLLALLLNACAGTDAIRLIHDLRPQAERSAVFWPQPPNTARYRNLGQLAVQPNFENNVGQARGPATPFAGPAVPG